jgi:ABC-type arginine transport system permease subunit
MVSGRRAHQRRIDALDRDDRAFGAAATALTHAAYAANAMETSLRRIEPGERETAEY